MTLTSLGVIVVSKATTEILYCPDCDSFCGYRSSNKLLVFFFESGVYGCPCQEAC